MEETTQVLEEQGHGWLDLIHFKDKFIAVIAFVLFLLPFIIVLSPLEHMEKAGFMLAMGFGVGYFVQGARIFYDFSALAVWMALGGVVLIVSAWYFTPASVLAASALEDQVPVIVGGAMSFFGQIRAIANAVKAKLNPEEEA